MRVVCRVDAVCVLLELLSPTNSTMRRGPRPPPSEHYAFLYSRPHVSENGGLGFKVVWQRAHHKVRHGRGHPVTFCCDLLSGSRIGQRRRDRLEPVPSTPYTTHTTRTALRRGSRCSCAVGSGLRSIVEKQLGSHSRWSRWPDEVLLHAARVRRTARSRSLAAEK